MAERVVPSGASVRWEPNAPDAVLIASDAGCAVLALNAHPDDASQDCVIFRWSDTRAAVMGPPGDEARSGHRLFPRGLSELMWSGIVENSEWIIELEHRNRVHPGHDPARFSMLTHFILPLKDDTAEVVAEAVEILRCPGPPLAAASAVLQQLSARQDGGSSA